MPLPTELFPSVKTLQALSVESNAKIQGLKRLTGDVGRIEASILPVSNVSISWTRNPIVCVPSSGTSRSTIVPPCRQGAAI